MGGEQCGHRDAAAAMRWPRMACRIAGRLGCGGGPVILFSPSGLLEAAGLQEGVGDHRHQRVPVQAGPGSALEVVEAEFLLQLLMRLLADPARLDRAGQLLERGVRRAGWRGSTCARRSSDARRPARPPRRAGAGRPCRRCAVAGRRRRARAGRRSGPRAAPWCRAASSPSAMARLPASPPRRPTWRSGRGACAGGRARRRERSSPRRPDRPSA